MINERINGKSVIDMVLDKKTINCQLLFQLLQFKKMYEEVHAVAREDRCSEVYNALPSRWQCSRGVMHNTKKLFELLSQYRGRCGRESGLTGCCVLT